MASSPHECDQRNAHKQRQTEQDDIDGDWVVVKRLVRGSVESCLCEVEKTGETDDEAVDFTEGREAEDFGGVVAIKMLVLRVWWEGWSWEDLRYCSVV